MKNLISDRLTIAVGQAAVLTTLLCNFAIAADLYNDGEFSGYTPDVENGETVFQASACGSCHGLVDDQSTLAGGLEFSNKLGTFFAPNITSSAEHGIGGWSNARFLNAVLRGTKDDGSRYYGSVFPFAAYSRMAPEDALDMRAYMATLPESDGPSKPHNISFPSKMILRQWSDERPVLVRAQDPQIQRGEYLAEALGHCSECHTPRNIGALTYKLDPDSAYEGETGMFGNFAPKISGEHLQAFGPEAFVIGNLLQSKKLTGAPLTVASKRRFAQETAKLPLSDRAAIYAYLTAQPINVSSLADADAMAISEMQGTPTTKIELQEPAVDMTGATELMQRVEAHCTAPKPAAQNAAAVGGSTVSPALQAGADSVIEGYCRDCHGAGNKNASSFLTGHITELAKDRMAVVPGNPEASPLYISIANDRMPIGSKMTPDQVRVLADWISALGEQPAVEQHPATAETRPSIPKYVGGTLEEMHLAAVQDLRALDRKDWEHMRYFSFAYTPLPEIDCAAEGLARNPVYYLHSALNKFINSVSRGNSVMPVKAVEGTNGALVRIDLRDYGWNDADWQGLSTGEYTDGAQEADFTESVWKELATLYPYSIAPSAEPMLNVLSNATGAQVPIMRADWFTRFASEAPYYDMLLRLPSDIAVLERRLKVDVNANIRSQRIIRAGFDKGQSGVSDHNRMLERHDLPLGGYYWKSYDFASSEGEGSLMAHPDGPAEMGRTASGTVPFVHDGGEMIFTLPNGLQGYYLSTAQGERLLVGPTSIVSNRNKAVGRGVEIVNARSCFECHNNGIIFNTDVVRPSIMSSSLFTKEQREILLRMYPDGEDIQNAYQRDLDLFVAALDRLDITQTTTTGKKVSLRPPESTGEGELVTYLADQHFAGLDLLGLAREFDLDVKTLKERSFSIADARLSQIVTTWIRRTENGLTVSRDEVETFWSALLPRLTHLDAHSNVEVLAHLDLKTPDDFDVATAAAVTAVTEKPVETFAPKTTATGGYEVATTQPNPMHLSLSVPEVNVHVDDLLVFDVSTNRDCELQLLYIEENKVVEEWPAATVGPPILKAGEVRRIPFPGSGIRVRFDEPGNGETLLAFCRVDGLGPHRLAAEDAIAYAREHFQPFTRGITFEVEKQVAKDAGQSAYNSVTFNVR